VELLTIGAFSRASRLSPKALRLYDSLGLLAPAHVDEMSGYRFYRPDQLERARLAAWLRRLGMPLARIRVVCDLAADAPDQAAGDPEQAVARLIGLANEAGGPDNIACVVADVIEPPSSLP
jgi:PPM family protein phosphatase